MKDQFNFNLKDKTLLFPIIIGIILLVIIFLIAFKTLEKSTPPDTSLLEPTPVVQVNDPKVKTKVVNAVENLDDVQNFKKTVAAQGNSQVVTEIVTEIDTYPTDENSFYLVHVYELVPHGDGTAHTATHGWYRFYPQSNVVRKQSYIDDTVWESVQ